MIPKTIHYCWFGSGTMSPLHQRCVESWKRLCPDYEIVLWNEQNADIDNAYCREAIVQRKWAFVSDWVRFDVLSKHGGIYLDTDVELIRSLDEIVAMNGFVIARESDDSIGAGFIACEPNDPVMREACRLMATDLTEQRVFATSPVVVKQAIALYGGGRSTILDSETFYPFNPHDRHRPANAMQLMYSDITPRTIGIHHYGLSVSWKDPRFRRAIFKLLKKLQVQRRWDISFQPFKVPAR